MLRKFSLNFKKGFFNQHPKLLLGDWLIIFFSAISIILMFQQFWVTTPASQFKIRHGNEIIGIFDLNQSRELHIKGALGESHISIQNGRVRFKQSPCSNQYCVHQGWLTRAGQVAICLPNQIGLQLMGAKSAYDSLNY
ncbi:MAG: NusG domain II-containing protein [Methylotenera sp.]|nr:NusG domain II-containing protein [Methylotenera sp.]